MHDTAPAWRGGKASPDPDIGRLKELAQQLRVDSIRISAAMGLGDPMAALSAAELVAVLMARHLRVAPGALDDPARDHLILSRGHAVPVLYAALLSIGVIDEDELLDPSRPGSRLEPSPGPGIPLVDTATGALGLALAVGTGMALAMQRLEPRASRVWVVGGDTELAEGTVWDAVEAAGSERLDALTVIVDVNRAGGAVPTRHGWNGQALRRRFEAFDWRVIEVDGHDVRAIDTALRTASDTRFRPAVILARTIRGRGVRRVADQPGLPGKPLVDAEDAIAELGGIRRIRITPPTPLGARPRDRRSGGHQAVLTPTWSVGSVVATRDAVGEGLVALGTGRPELVVLDVDGRHATHLDRFRDVDPQRYFQALDTDELLAGAAIGFAIRGWAAVVGAPRSSILGAADVARVAADGGTPLRLVACATGLGGVDRVAPDTLEDLAVFRAIDGSAVLVPSDANQAAGLLGALLDWPGVGYMRVDAATTTVRTPARTRVRIGGSREVARSADDRVAIIAAGPAIDAAVEAAALLDADKVRVRILDAYSVKPLDVEAVAAAAAAVEGRVVVVEEHRPEGGLGSAVAEAMAALGQPIQLVQLAIQGRAGTGHAGSGGAATGAAAIADAVRALANGAIRPDAPLQDRAPGEGDGL